MPGQKTASGQPKRITVRDTDEKAFRRKLEEAKRLHGLGVIFEDTLVREWAERWLSVYKANTTDTQKAHYAAKLYNDILPNIGPMRMRDVRPSNLQELLNSYSGGKVGTVQKIRGAIQQLFGDAEVEGVIERNPAARLQLPEMSESERRPLTVIERMAVYEVAKYHKNGAYVLTMLFCGLRRGECCGLLVGDIDIPKRRITIDKALSLRKNIGVVSSTKAAKLRKRNVKNAEDVGTRVVPIPTMLLPFLEVQCSGRGHGDILFPKSPGGSEYATKQVSRGWWHSFARACHILLGATVYRNKVDVETSPFGNEVTPHYLRHTYATDIYAAGVDEKAQKVFLGHSSSDVTDIYRKMSEAAFIRALDLIDKYNETLCLFPYPGRRSKESFKYCLACENKS